jgi:hypothetical protein
MIVIPFILGLPMLTLIHENRCFNLAAAIGDIKTTFLPRICFKSGPLPITKVAPVKTITLSPILVPFFNNTDAIALAVEAPGNGKHPPATLRTLISICWRSNTEAKLAHECIGIIPPNPGSKAPGVAENFEKM